MSKAEIVASTLLGGAVVAGLVARRMKGRFCSAHDKIPLEPLAPYGGNGVPCDPVPKPGMIIFAADVVRMFGGGDGGIVNRACGQTGPVSDHYWGGAFDWKVLPGWTVDGVFTEPDLPGFLAWATGPDCRGRPAAIARRAGLTYIIAPSGKRNVDLIWRSYDVPGHPASTWYEYPTTRPHLNHVHISIGRDGSRAATSYFKRGFRSGRI